MGHWAWGIGHWAWGIGHWASGIAHRASGIGHRASGIPDFLENRYSLIRADALFFNQTQRLQKGDGENVGGGDGSRLIDNLREKCLRNARQLKLLRI
jgi:hypothetical protein